MEAAADRVVVRFEGEGAGTGELAWGQQEAWMSIRRLGSWMPLGGVKPLPPGTTLEDVSAELSYLMSRFQVLRTRVLFDPEQRPMQELFASGEIVLEVFDADDDYPAEVAARVRRGYADADLDFATEWPIRMGVVRARGVLTHMIVLLSHFAVDAYGAQVMLSEVAARTTAPVAGMQPLDQARWQSSPAGRRQNAAALRYHEAVLRSIEPRRFNVRHEPREAAVWSGEFTSRALPMAVAEIVARMEADTAAVLLAVFAVALTRVTSVNPVVIRPLVGNRFRSGLSDVVCSAAQSGLCVLDVADTPFEEVLRRVQRATMTAYKHAYHNPFDLEELVDRVSRERGADIEIACFFNNRRGETPARAAAPSMPQQVREALAHSAFRWTATAQSPMRRTFARVQRDVGDAMQLSLLMDSTVLSLDDGEAWLRGTEAVAIEAVGHWVEAELDVYPDAPRRLRG